MLAEHIIGSAGKGLVMGWVRPPADGLWKPRDLVWTSPGTKAMDLAGEIVEAKTFPDFMEGHAWVTAQLKKRDRYLEVIRERVLDGSMEHTAAIAKLLGMPFSDGALLRSTEGGVDLLAGRARFIAQNVGRLAQ